MFLKLSEVKYLFHQSHIGHFHVLLRFFQHLVETLNVLYLLV